MTRRTMLAVAVIVTAIAAACSSSSTTVTKPASPSTVPATSGPNGSSASTSPTTATTDAAACTPARPAGTGQTEHSFTYNGTDRTYLTYVPPGYDGTKPVPVVFEFHGYGSSAAQQIAYGNFKPEADRDTFLIVAPNGVGTVGRHFDLGKDVGMTGALLDRIEKTFCVDTKRAYVTGMSDGGAMTSFIACQLHDRFAAFGPVALTIRPLACPRGDVPIMAFHGTADPVVPFNGGKVRCCGNPTLPSIPSALANWAKRNGCDATPTDTTVGTEVTKRTWSGCKTGAVTFYIINGGGHTWPGTAFDRGRLGKVTKQIDASQTLWDFFKTQSLA